MPGTSAVSLKRRPHWLSGLFFVATLAGCAYMPAQGPNTLDLRLTEIEQEQLEEKFLVIDMTAEAVASFGPLPSPNLSVLEAPAASAPAHLYIDAGDRLIVTIWEPSTDGLFSASGSPRTDIEVAVEADGSIFIPYAGQISVAELTTDQTRAVITQRLARKAIDPQVQVRLIKGTSQKLSIIGDVVATGQYDVPVTGMRLADAIAVSGGSKFPTYETRINIIRGGSEAAVSLEDIIANPDNNVSLMPADIVQFIHDPRSFSVFGAVTSKNLQPFTKRNITLAEALAQSGGLNDNTADPTGVFLFRFEDPARLTQFGFNEDLSVDGGLVPTIFKFDFFASETFFLASQFEVQDEDIIYVATAPAAQFRKFMSVVLSPFFSAAGSINSLNR